MVWFSGSWTPWPFSPVGGIVVGLAGLLVIITTVFMRYLLPDGVRVSRGGGGRACSCLFSRVRGARGAARVGFGWARDECFDGLHIRFIGGLDSNIVIFLLGLVILLYVASATFEHQKPPPGRGCRWRS